MAVITEFPAIDFKYFAGADWLESLTSAPRIQPSDLGRAVADVLGYVYRGIYHIHRDVVRDRTIWANEDAITLSIYGTSATWDMSELTLLVVACNQMGLRVDLRGSKGGYIRHTFMWEPERVDLIQKGQELAKICPSPSLRHLKQFMVFTKPIRESWDEDGSPKFMSFLESDLMYERLIRCVIVAHHMAIRVEVGGHCPTSLILRLHRRDPNRGETWARHPKWEEVGRTIEWLNKCQ